MTKKKDFFPKDSFKIYWEAYGGWQDLWSSFYLWVAVVCSLLCLCFQTPKFSWAQTALGIVPDWCCPR